MPTPTDTGRLRVERVQLRDGLIERSLTEPQVDTTG